MAGVALDAAPKGLKLLKLSRKTDYGLIALRHIAAQGSEDVSSAREIADGYGVSYELVSKILQTLKRFNVISSVQGVAGGYRLARDLAGVSLFDLVEMIEGPQGIVECTREDGAPPCEMMGGCNILLPMRELNRKVMDVLRETSLASLFAEAGALPGRIDRGSSGHSTKGPAATAS